MKLHIFLKIKTMLLEIQTFNVEKKHGKVHNTKNKAENEKQINSNLSKTPLAQIHLLLQGIPNQSQSCHYRSHY